MTQSGSKVPPPERPALTARTHAYGHTQPLCLTATAPLRDLGDPLTSNNTNREETPVLSSIRSYNLCFLCTAPVTEWGHTGVLVPWESWATHRCRHAEISTISFGYKPKRNSIDDPKQYHIETETHFGDSN